MELNAGTTVPEIADPDEPLIIRFSLEGDDRDGDTVGLRDFLEFVGAALEVLKRIERNLTGARQATIDYRIVDLEYGSANLAVQPPRLTGRRSTLPNRVTSQFATGLKLMESPEQSGDQLDHDTRAAFEAMKSQIGKGIRSASIEVADVHVEFSAGGPRMLALTPRTSAAAVGSYSGSIDALNVHKEFFFYLYPPTGSARVKCVFDPALLDDVRTALKRYTTVRGLIEYAEGSYFPARIVVDQIEVHPADDRLPRLADLWGIAPNITGGMDSVAYVRSLRNAR